MKKNLWYMAFAAVIGVGFLGLDTAAQTLDSSSIEKYVDPLPKPAVVQGFKSKGKSRTLGIGMYEILQKLHRDLPPTRVWAYGESKATATFPGPTLEIRKDVATRIKWKNRLPKHHFLAVDTTIHWANPPKWPGHGVPTTVHVHGGEQEPASDGHPDAWFTRNFGQKGPEFVRKTYFYHNQQESTTLWYHDHALGLTRLNVYAGLAGFYLVRDPSIEDSLNLPSGDYEIPVLIQDRSFNEDGSLYYPAVGVNPDVHPQWVPEFFGDVILSNGVIWPYVEVEPRKYRFRLLNGSNARFYNMSLTSGQDFIQIGGDGGYLSEPVTVRPLMLAPGERADVILDFSGMAVGTEILLSNDANAPFPGGDPVTEDTSQILQFRVVPLTGPDTSTIPAQLNPIERPGIADVTRTLTLKELEDAITGDPLGVFLNGSRWGNPGDVSETPRVGSTEIWEIVNLTDDAHPIHLHLVDFQLLNRQDFDVDSYEAAWDELNPVVPTQDPKNLPVGPYLWGNPIPPPPNERAEKDTIRAFPGQVTRIIIGFTSDTEATDFPFDATARPGYVWHCHILEHEDNEMMRRMQLTKGSR